MQLGLLMLLRSIVQLEQIIPERSILLSETQGDTADIYLPTPHPPGRENCSLLTNPTIAQGPLALT